MSDNDQGSPGGRIKDIRVARHMTQLELATAVGISERTLRRLEADVPEVVSRFADRVLMHLASTDQLSDLDLMRELLRRLPRWVEICSGKSPDAT